MDKIDFVLPWVDGSDSVRMAIAFVAMLPILCLYPFLQRYFTKGIALGAVKG